MSAELTLQRIKAILEEDSGLAPYELPEIPASDIDPTTADGKTVQSDGSVWYTSKGESGPAGTLVQEIYGYISQKKNPAMWDRMVRALGEERLKYALKVGGPYARYKTNPDAVLLSGTPNGNVLGMLLSQPITKRTEA